MENLWAADGTWPQDGRALRCRRGAARAARVRCGWTALPFEERLRRSSGLSPSAWSIGVPKRGLRSPASP
eukprot:4752019-Pyramimonas_sp.AAC.1